MKERLILRAAVKYREWLIKQAQTQPRSAEDIVYSQHDAISRRSQDLNKWIRRFFNGTQQRVQRFRWAPDMKHRGITCPVLHEQLAVKMLKDIGMDISASANLITNTLAKTINRNNILRISLRQAIEEIRVISTSWQDVNYRNGILSLITERIKLQDENEKVELGQFVISLNLCNPMDEEGLNIKGDGDHNSDRGYYHPHVSSGMLCTGDGGVLMTNAILQGRLEDYFVVVDTILKTYNHEDSHESLRQWYDPEREDEFLCEYCDDWRDNENASFCNNCDNTYCDTCEKGGDYCHKCDEWYCEECSSNCTDCGNVMCDQCAVKCESCQEPHCQSCIRSCCNCAEQYCPACLKACIQCGDNMCDECSSMCGCCGDIYCNECIISECEECEIPICDECKHECDECGKTICTKCKDNSCEDCGVPMCTLCTSKHNCLLLEVETQD